MRPTPGEVLAARGRAIPDVLAPGLAVVFCGINPSLYSAAVGHHFARPGNRFWPALHQAGFTPRLMAPEEDSTLPACRIGLTNLVAGATARAGELTPQQLRRGAEDLAAKMVEMAPQFVAIAGVSAYRLAFGARAAGTGPQERTVGGCRVWVLPNPSGLNAHYRLAHLVAVYAELRLQVAPLDGRDRG